MKFFIHPNFILTQDRKTTKKKILEKAAKYLNKAGITSFPVEQILHDLEKREKEGNTEIGHQIALPHSINKEDSVKGFGGMVVIRLKTPIVWHSNSAKVTMVWALLSHSEFHLRILKELSLIISRPDLVKQLLTADPKKFVDIMKKHLPLLNGKEEKKQKFSKAAFLKTCDHHRTFTLPPGFRIHTRPAAAIAEFIKFLPAEFFFVTESLSVKADSVTDLLKTGNQKKITIAVRFLPNPSSPKLFSKTYKERAVNFIKQIEVLIVQLAWDEFNSQNYYENHSSPISFRQNSEYRKLVGKFSNRHLLVKIETLPNRFNPQNLDGIINSQIYFYQRVENNFSELTGSFPKQMIIPDKMNILSQAIEVVVGEIEDTISRLRVSGKKNPKKPIKEIMQSHIEILRDHKLLDRIEEHLRTLSARNPAKPQHLIQAWDRVVKDQIDRLKRYSHRDYLSRITDWQDLSRKVSNALGDILRDILRNHPWGGSQTDGGGSLTERIDLIKEINKLFSVKKCPVILITEDIFPSEVISLISSIKQGKLAAMVLGQGNKNSHSAIMLTSFSLPVGIIKNKTDYKKLSNYLKGKLSSYIVLDFWGSSAFICPNSNIADQTAIALERALSKTYTDRVSQPDQPSSEYVKIKKARPFQSNNKSFLDNPDLIFSINLNNIQELEFYLEKKTHHPYNRIQGMGLMRTELFFSGNFQKPAFSHQVKLYERVARAFSPYPAVIRTLDIAKDKPLPFLNSHKTKKSHIDDFLEQSKKISQFENREMSFLTEQIYAICHAHEKFPNIRILFPMISSFEDFFIYYTLLDKIKTKHHLNFPISIGVMLEVPGLIFQIKFLNRFVDYYSLGGNDLQQFLTLESRNRISHPRTLNHFPILMALDHILMSAGNLPVTLCGNQASHPQVVSDFFAQGLKRFSVPIGSIERLSQFSFSATSETSKWRDYFSK